VAKTVKRQMMENHGIAEADADKALAPKDSRPTGHGVSAEDLRATASAKPDNARAESLPAEHPTARVD